MSALSEPYRQRTRDPEAQNVASLLQRHAQGQTDSQLHDRPWCTPCSTKHQTGIDQFFGTTPYQYAPRATRIPTSAFSPAKAAAGGPSSRGSATTSLECYDKSCLNTSNSRVCVKAFNLGPEGTMILDGCGDECRKSRGKSVGDLSTSNMSSGMCQGNHDDTFCGTGSGVHYGGSPGRYGAQDLSGIGNLATAIAITGSIAFSIKSRKWRVGDSNISTVERENIARRGKWGLSA